MLQRLDVACFDEVYRVEAGPAVGFIVLHRVLSGLAVGGLRIASYPDELAALQDVQRLARTMTWKCVMAGLPVGGGKAVLLAPPPERRGEAVRRMGEAVNALEGRFHTGGDLGFGARDLADLTSVTAHVACGALAAWTARTVQIAMHAATRPRKVAVQGLGAVGRPLAEGLRAEGVEVVASDLLPVEDFPIVSPDALLQVECDVMAPCARGGVLDARSIPGLRCRVVCGGANHPLATEEDAWRLHRRGILSIPDFVANCGATIRGVSDVLGQADRVEDRIEGVADTVRQLLERSEREGLPPDLVARALAEERLRNLR